MPKKTKKLVDEHGYPERLTIFWSHTLSNSKRLRLKKTVREKTGIELEVYDATQLDQIITEDCPDVLTYLIRHIHKIEVNKGGAVDPKDRAFYDYLALGKDAADLKTSIIDAQIISILFSSSPSKVELIGKLESAGIRPGVSAARISALVSSGRLVRKEQEISLSITERHRISNIIAKDDAERVELLEKLRAYSVAWIKHDISKEALEIILDVYRLSSVDIQVSEIEFEPPRMTMAKDLVHNLEVLIQAKGTISSSDAKRHATELLKIGAENDYLSNQCSSLLCVRLLGQKKLDKYIQEKVFFIYLDATVFIRYLALYGFNKPEDFDEQMLRTANLRDVIRSLPSYKVSVTREHLEETVRHITQAEKISRFASEAVLAQFGESKNVYFNLYLREKRRYPNLTFDVFLEKLIGYERTSASNQGNFEAYLSCVERFNTIAKIDVPSYNLDDDEVAQRISTRYEYWANGIGKHRKHRTAFNDVVACYVMSDENRHLDSKGYGHTPMFVTWDSTQHQLRQIYRREFPTAEWLIYSPQRAIERFSMLDFSVNAGAIRDTVLAILDEDYTRDSSLIDALASIFGESKIESDAIISVLAKLSGRLHGETVDAGHFEAEERNTLVEALLNIEYEFRSVFDDVRKAFAATSNQDRIVNILTQYIEGKIKRDGLNREVNLLVETTKSKVAGPAKPEG
ncbi:hypothetical protein ALDI51_17050 [Alicycliphilus denitrificans]|uniref:hypothetical protein n=1 Tax=Alicycliphilus denitrificans TaxID=179636 RepID=UPI001915B4CA|nr:hypothetical protein [Alicycliphilus denitrificans]MBN9574183.1 hypothetical protein [Alicycliphilus denitrificans]BCN38386.1 hypothetical protein ALDI51_17050 [Alicycliphilus denitrificans]